MSGHTEVLPFFGLGHWEILAIGGVIVLLFFGRRIPEMMRSLGKGVTQFKKGLKEGGEGEGGDGDRTKALPSPETTAPQRDTKGVEAEEKEPGGDPS